MSGDPALVRYDGTNPFPVSDLPAQTLPQRSVQLAVTGLIVAGPFAGLIAAVWLLWGHGVGFADIGLAVFFYVLTGFGVTVGFHRCLTHRSFTARPALRVALAVAGSMSFQGAVNGWVAAHRRHHAFTDRPGDPHSPYRYGTGPAGQLRGVTWSVNSLCHLFGSRPFATRRHDRATNLWPLAVLSLGESWHNMHHSDPTCARHGVDRSQLDLSAVLIRAFELAGWVRGVRWPDAGRLEQRRRRPGEAATYVQAGRVPASVMAEPGSAAVR